MKINVSFCGLLTLIFVAAKLWDRVDWSWVWVFSPLWIGLAAVVGVAVALALVSGLCFTVAGIVGWVRGAHRMKRAARHTPRP